MIHINKIDTAAIKKHLKTLTSKTQFFFHKKGRSSRMLCAFVYIPTFLTAFYLFLLASPMYISTSHFALRSSEGQELPAIPGMLFQASSPTTLDAYIIQNYITSPDMLFAVNAHLDLHEHYADRKRDIISRLWQTPTKEELLKFWQHITSVVFDPDKGIITVEVKAYTPQMANAVNTAILKASEELVNTMNKRARSDAIRLTKDEAMLAEKRLATAQIAMQKFRDEKSILDPKATALSLESVVTRLETEAAALQAELNTALHVMRTGSPQVKNLQSKLKGIKTQLATEKERLAGLNGKNGTLSSLVGDYTHLATEEEFAREHLVRAMSALEMARIKAISQSRYIVPFQMPTLPEESLYPNPYLYTLFTFLFLLVLLGICSLVIAAVKDHMGA